MAKTRPCNRVIARPVGEEGFSYDCPYPAMSRKQVCEWHWLQRQPSSVQETYRDRRLARAHGEEIDRVPKERWPSGERWCAGCQSFVPLFYTSGSRCSACASAARHQQMVRRVYDLAPGEYDKLLKLQGGRCYICQRKSVSKRLAVDHDHKTRRVRGLLCPGLERGCNHAILGNITDLAMAKRIVAYLEDPPYDRLQRGDRTAIPGGDRRPNGVAAVKPPVDQEPPPF